MRVVVVLVALATSVVLGACGSDESAFGGMCVGSVVVNDCPGDDVYACDDGTWIGRWDSECPAGNDCFMPEGSDWFWAAESRVECDVDGNPTCVSARDGSPSNAMPTCVRRHP